MILGKIRNLALLIFLVFGFCISTYALDEVEVAPLIDLESISPTFEEGKDELEKKDEESLPVEKKIDNTVPKKKKNGKVFVNLKALDKITAKTSEIKIEVGKKEKFRDLEIKALKCSISENKDISDIVAYLQVKDLSIKNKDQVFVFNGWTFASSPALRPIDHPVYDLWLIGCENI